MRDAVCVCVSVRASENKMLRDSIDMSVSIVEVPSDQRLEQVRPERCSRGNLYVCEDMHRRQIMLVAQKITNIQAAIEELFPCETPAASSLFDASARKQHKGRTGAWSVQKLEPHELSPYLAERRKHFTRTVIATRNPAAWQFAQVA